MFLFGLLGWYTEVMRRMVKSFLGIIVLVGIVYFVVSYAPQIQETIGVKGISTQQKVQDISDHVSKDVHSEISKRASQAGELKINQMSKELSRFQKIPQDLMHIKDFVQSKIAEYTTRNK